MMHQLDSDWLTVTGGSIVGAIEGCGTILSGESLYFSQVIHIFAIFLMVIQKFLSNHEVSES